MGPNREILIIGGGVIGMALARELQRRQAGRVKVIERDKPGRGASFAAAGMLAPNAECETVDDFYRLCDESRILFPALAEELLQETGVDIELDRSGTLYAAFSHEDAAHLSSKYSNQVAAGIPVKRLSYEETLEAEPCVSRSVRESLYFPNDWQVENRLLLHALTKYATDRGIEVEEATVDSLISENGRVVGANAGGHQTRAEVTVLATGAWTSLIKIGSAPMPFNVKPIRGQMMSYKSTDRLFRRVIYSPRGYLVPRIDGRILAGATVEDAGFDTSLTESAMRGLRKMAEEIAPCLKDAKPAESWTGLRPYAADGLPVIGTVDGQDGLFVATAHYRNGILLAPVTARLLADRIVNGTDSEYLTLFGPQRFGGKEVNAGAVR